MTAFPLPLDALPLVRPLTAGGYRTRYGARLPDGSHERRNEATAATG